MSQIAVDQARPGMVLAAEVVDRRGRLLVPAGKELSDRHVSALRMWGVVTIEVRGDGPAGTPEPVFSAAVLEAARARVEELFANVDREHPFIEVLQRESRQRIAAELARAEAGAR